MLIERIHNMLIEKIHNMLIERIHNMLIERIHNMLIESEEYIVALRNISLRKLTHAMYRDFFQLSKLKISLEKKI